MANTEDSLIKKTKKELVEIILKEEDVERTKNQEIETLKEELTKVKKDFTDTVTILDKTANLLKDYRKQCEDLNSENKELAEIIEKQKETITGWSITCIVCFVAVVLLSIFTL